MEFTISTRGKPAAMPIQQLMNQHLTASDNPSSSRDQCAIPSIFTMCSSVPAV